MSIELFMFALEDAAVVAAADAGLDAVVVDLEQQGKRGRQEGFDTGVSAHELADVPRVRALTSLPLVVRVEAPGPSLPRMMATVADAGADELLVPMVADADEVEAVLEETPDGMPVGVLVERASAVADIERIAALPLARVYVGLMDLMVERGGSSPFDALIDGTVERVGRSIPHAFGVGGLTRPGHGEPVPAHLVAGELLRVGADFTFLRRSFFRAVAATDLASTVAAVRTMLVQLETRGRAAVTRDRMAFERHVPTVTS